ncbi:T9SS type A sorting domain-containing protein [Flavobacterium pedocola]
MKKILFFLFTTSSCLAQTLDPGFGYNSSGIIDHGISNNEAKQIIYDAQLQPDGKTVCIGRFSTNYNAPSTNFIARYNTDGTFDRSFNQKGWRTGSGVFSQAVYLQNDNKILTVSGRSVSRFLANGDIDISFNTTGINNISTGSNNITIKAVIQQQDNKIVVVGYLSNGTNNDFVAARLNSDGSLDTAFDSDGILILPIGTGHDEAFSVKLQSDNKIIIGGQSIVGGAYDFALVRLNPNGTLDSGFGTNGITTVPISANNDYGRSLDILSNGKIVMAGSAAGKFAIVKFNTDGTLDTTFGSANGKLISTENVTLTLGNSANALHRMPIIKALADDKLLVSGTSDNNYKLIKYLANGSATDTSFGNSGGIFTFDNENDVATYLTVKPDNSITMGGYSSNATSFYRGKRFDISENGTFATGTDWITTYVGYDSPKDIKLLADGKYLILVDTPTPSIRRHNANGSVDTSFGIAGVTTLPSDDYSYNMAIQNDSKIIVTGNQTLKRFNADGTADSFFGTNGSVDLFEASGYTVSYVDNIHLLPNGQILVAVDYDDGGTSFGMLRMNSDGTFDTTFGSNGMFTTRFIETSSTFTEFPREIVVQSNNKIIIIGVTDELITPTLDYNLCALRLSPDGVLDTTFGTNGKVVLQLNSGNYPFASQVLADDKFLVSSRIGTESKTFKFTANGALDPTFGTNGIAADAAGTNNQGALSVQPDGKFIKGGTKNGHASMSRYNTDGTVDNTFGINGNGELGLIMYNNSKVVKTLLQPDNKLVILGESYLTRMFSGDVNLNFLARYTDVQLGTLALENQNSSLLIYPNPIENEATFEYTLENNETITVDIIDLQGRIVKKVIANKTQPAGKHSLRFTLDGNISPGNYFLTIATAKGRQSVQILKK